mmetsp:Transcript_75988/g.211062  ORF Transcript_75988/g.211062 Transcript_75988/m.211062 type:complete len:711 (-) Transcript_75988:85-2217(-)
MWDIEHNFEHYVDKWTAPVCYVVALLFFFLYFMSENSCIHRSERSERIWINWALCFAHVPSVISAMRFSKGVNDWILIFVRLILFLQILKENNSFRPHRPHREECVPSGDGDMRPFRHNTSARSDILHDSEAEWRYFSMRFAHELDLYVDEMMRVSRHSAITFVDNSMLIRILYVILVVADLLPNSGITKLDERYNMLAMWSYIIVQVMVATSMCVPRAYLFRDRAKSLHDMVERLIGSRDKSVINYVCETVSLNKFVEVADWQTIQLFTEEAVHKNLLGTKAKNRLIEALQKKGTVKHKVQHVLAQILLSSHGMELTALKNSIDARGNYHNLYKLVYSDIRNRRLRQRVLDHLTSEAQAVRFEYERAIGIKILSDIDDTLASSGGHFPAGVDARFPKRVVYPGCLSLFRILDRRSDEDMPSCNLVFLSARPHIFKDYTEDHTYLFFKMLVEEGAMHTMPTLLPGKLRKGVFAFVSHAFLGAKSWRGVGECKMTAYQNYRELYREYDFIFFGDSGQGDLVAAQLMVAEQSVCGMLCVERSAAGLGWRTPRTSATVLSPDLPCMRAVVIHEVVTQEKWLVKEDVVLKRGSAWRQKLLGEIVFHKTYIGAALALCRLDEKLVSADDVYKVTIDAIEEFNRMRLLYPEWEENWAPAERHLSADVQKVNDFQKHSSNLTVRHIAFTIMSTKDFRKRTCHPHLRESPSTVEMQHF